VTESAVVIGGGLAGISAALRLADAGHAVTLVESRPRLGGAAFSFSRGPLSIDNGQHVFLRCCEAYRWLLTRLGANDDVVVQSQLDIPVLRADGRRGRISRLPGVPAPLHLSAALARYPLLGLTDRLRAARGALALRTLDPADRSLDRADAADVGYARVPLGAIHSTAATLALEKAEVEVALNHRVEHVEPGGLVRAHTATGPRTWQADSVILAVPHEAAFAMAPALLDTAAAPACELTSAPIVNVHVIYDRQVTDLAFAAAVDSPVQWFFDRSATSGLRHVHPDGQYLAITVSAADGIIDTPTRELRELFLAELARLLPSAGKAEVLDVFVTRERRATFRQSAGSATIRPQCDDGPEGIWLAGAWTDTGWPDTMESAVRSGISAAEGALRTAPADATRFAA
jgi:hydroxysqualene dehydroxylase